MNISKHISSFRINFLSRLSWERCRTFYFRQDRILPDDRRVFCDLENQSWLFTQASKLSLCKWRIRCWFEQASMTSSSCSSPSLYVPNQSLSCGGWHMPVIPPSRTSVQAHSASRRRGAKGVFFSFLCLTLRTRLCLLFRLDNAFSSCRLHLFPVPISQAVSVALA